MSPRQFVKLCEISDDSFGDVVPGNPKTNRFRTSPVAPYRAPSGGSDANTAAELTYEDVAGAAEQIGAPVDAIPDDAELMSKVLEILSLPDTDENQMSVMRAIEQPNDLY